MIHEPGSRGVTDRNRSPLSVKMVIVLVVTVLIGVYAFWFGLYVFKSTFRNADVLSIENDFSGIFGDSKSQKSKTFHIMIVHGIGSQCLGYSHEFISAIMKKKHMKDADDLPKVKISQIVDELDQLVDLDGYEMNSLTVNQWITNYDTDLCGKLGTTGSRKRTDDRNGVGIAVCKAIHRDSDQTNHDCEIIRSPNPADQSVYGFLRTSEYQHDSNAALKAKIYELVWDPVTAASINKFLHLMEYQNKTLGPDWINSRLKTDILHEKIADAVLYIGGFQKEIQFTTVMAMCQVMKSIGGGLGAKKSIEDPGRNNPDRFKEALYGTFSCGQTALKEANTSIQNSKKKQLASNHEIIMISHSLGTRLLFDTLGLVSSENFIDDLDDYFDLTFAYSKSLKENAESLRNYFQMLTTKIIVFANQVPLLAIPNNKKSAINNEVKNSDYKVDGSKKKNASFCRNVVRLDYTTRVLTTDLGENFTRFLKGRKKTYMSFNATAEEFLPLEVLTFSEPNDILNYDLDCWYSMHVAPSKLEEVRKEQWIEQCKNGIKDRAAFCSEAISKLKSENKYLFNKITEESGVEICRSALSLPERCNEPYDIPYFYSPLFTPENNRSRYYEKAVEEVCDGQACDSQEINAECKAKLQFANLVLVELANKAGEKTVQASNSRNCSKQSLVAVSKEIEEGLNLELVNITTDLAKWRFQPWVADPASVHTHYWEADKVHSLVACGGNKRTNQPNQCAEP